MIARLVLDASVALAWIVRATEEQARYADAVLRIIERDATACCVSHLWHLEIAHQLRALKVAGALTCVIQLTAITHLEALMLHTHYLALEVRQLLDLSDLYHLAAYDCLYVRLAEREGVPLATVDGGMRLACERLGVELLDL